MYQLVKLEKQSLNQNQ